jgi:hypothetical protein
MRAPLPRDSDVYVLLYFVLLLIYGVNHIMNFTIVHSGYIHVACMHVCKWQSRWLCIHSRGVPP